MAKTETIVVIDEIVRININVRVESKIIELCFTSLTAQTPMCVCVCVCRHTHCVGVKCYGKWTFVNWSCSSLALPAEYPVFNPSDTEKT